MLLEKSKHLEVQIQNREAEIKRLHQKIDCNIWEICAFCYDWNNKLFLSCFYSGQRECDKAINWIWVRSIRWKNREIESLDRFLIKGESFLGDWAIRIENRSQTDQSNQRRKQTTSWKSLRAHQEIRRSFNAN